MDNTQTQLDQDAVTMAQAIRQSESGGNFSAKGKSGEIGGYQFTPDTWNASSMKYLKQSIPLEKATPAQQNEVAYRQIKEWKDQGKNVGQIASMWNAGAGEPDAYTGKFSNGNPAKGTNKFGASFDVPAYAKSVATAYHSLKGGGQVMPDINNPSNPNAPTGQAPTETKTGTQTHGGLLGKVEGVANWIAKPFIDLAAIPVQGAVAGINKLTGSNIADPFQNMPGAGGTGKMPVSKIDDWKGKGSSALQVGAEVSTAAGAGGLLGMLRGGGGALSSPAIKQVFKNYTGPGETISSLTNANKVDILTEALQTAGPSEGAILKQGLNEALKKLLLENNIGSFAELNPVKAKALGLAGTTIKLLLKGGANLAGLGILSKFLK